MILRGIREFFTKETRINGGGRRSNGYLKVGKMTIREGGNFSLNFASNAPRGGDNTSHDRSTLRSVENR